MVALSVSISAITSPGFTFSPSFFSHLARLPFSIVGESAGIRMLIGMGLLVWARSESSSDALENQAVTTDGPANVAGQQPVEEHKQHHGAKSVDHDHQHGAHRCLRGR